MTLPVAIALLLGAAVLMASARMLWQAARPRDGLRLRTWRLAFLLLAQAAGAVLLWFTLFPPATLQRAGVLTVLTADAAQVANPPAASGPVVALPEAGAGGARWLGAERVPDLGTALRRYPATQRIEVVGAGLAARDRDALRGQALVFHAAPLPSGLTELQLPVRVAVGRRFVVQGRGNDLEGGSAELLDPAGRRVERTPLDADGRFLLHGSARSAGPAGFRVRLRDARGARIEDAVLALDVAPARRLRALALAGAPNAELKYLRRWALDTGIAMDARIELGAGMQIASRPMGLDAATLDRQDLLVLDERSLRGLAAGQLSALDAAVARGLGLVIRQTLPPDAGDRARLRRFGFETQAGTAKETRLGAGFVRAGDAVDALPTLTATTTHLSAADGVTLLADASGRPLAAWRARGRGRVGVVAIDGSYRMALAGRGDAHGELWSRVFTTLARTAPGSEPPTIAAAAPGQRSIVCGIGAGASVVAANGRRTRLLPDPVSGAARCAGYWADTAGWHVLVEPAPAQSGGERRLPFHLERHAAMEAKAMRERTQALASPQADAQASGGVPVPGPRWPWFVAWLLLAAVAWWLERSRLGLQMASVRK